MKVSLEGNLTIETKCYSLEFDHNNLLVTYRIANEELYYGMSMLSAVDTVGEKDVTLDVEKPYLHDKGEDKYVVCIEETSRLWDRKQHFYHCYEDYFEYYTVLEGAGNIDMCYFFRGAIGDEELGSCPGFDIVVSGCPNFLGKKYFHVSDSLSIGVENDTNVWGHALSSGSLCYLFNRDFGTSWMSVGLAAREGDYRFQNFKYGYKPESVTNTIDSIVNTQSFSLSYYGKERVDGRWESPHIVVQADTDMYDLQKYVHWLYGNGYLHRRDKKIHDWWKKPIFCGWHEQIAKGLPNITEKSRLLLESADQAGIQCRQDNYKEWLGVLRDKGIPIGTVIIDMDWQANNEAFHETRGNGRISGRL